MISPHGGGLTLCALGGYAFPAMLHWIWIGALLAIGGGIAYFVVTFALAALASIPDMIRSLWK